MPDPGIAADPVEHHRARPAAEPAGEHLAVEFLSGVKQFGGAGS
jgi:hypothetical protein